MINFSCTCIKYFRKYDDFTIQANYKPDNKEIYDLTEHSADLTIITTMEDAIAAYEATAAYEMFINVIDQKYPGIYQLDPKYNKDT